MATGSLTTRRATGDDHPALARMLARAFVDDPVLAWTCRSQVIRRPLAERVFTIRLRQLSVHGEIWTTPDQASTAVWSPPGHWKTTTRQDLELGSCLLHPRLAWRIPLVAGGLLGVERKHPRSPLHWYLAVLGTDPPAQGRGLASSVLAPVLESCDRDGIPAYLETSLEENQSFYARHGFRVTGELRLPRGPTVWPMWREPR
jgi:ribosomal protein S18 acetylase RimI-like enzyme